MSTAVFPLGMRSAPSSGYNHKSTTDNKQYVSWKGTGINANPVASASGHIRPLTNNDPGNVFQTGFGLPRPIKHFRKGRVISAQPINSHYVTVPNPQNESIQLTIDEGALINYNLNRFVKSSKSTTLGKGGSGLVNDLMDKPAAYTVKINPTNQQNSVDLGGYNCNTCNGVEVITDYYPNETFLQDNPTPATTNPAFCCNNERKAKRRAIYASTVVKPNYYSSTKQYLQNRCKSYEQKSFNFLSNTPVNKNSNPGDPSSGSNTYRSNCQPNAQIYHATETALVAKMFDIIVTNNLINNAEFNHFQTLNINNIKGFFQWINTLHKLIREPVLNVFNQFMKNPYSGMPITGPSNITSCQLVVYKPSNFQYAQQGAVSSSTRNLKLKVDAITTNASSTRANYTNQLYAGDNNNIQNLLKNKSPGCNTPPYHPRQNKQLCYYKTMP